MSEIKFESVGVTIKSKPILKDISFELSAPSVIGLVGPNGAGKSTLLKCLAKVQDYSGTIWLDSAPHATLNSAYLARKIAYMPQDRVVHWNLGIREIVRLGRLPYHNWPGAHTDEDNQIVDQALADMDAAAFVDRTFHTLSGGEQARVLIARMLAQTPQILLADEPGNGLDPAHQINLMKLFRNRVKFGQTVILSLHDLSQAYRYCDRILLLNEGQLVADGPPAETLTPDLCKQVYNIEVMEIATPGGPTLLPIDSLNKDVS